jgi:hypothetical protein
MVFNTTFNNISFIPWRSVYWWRKPDYLEKTTDLLQDTDTFLFFIIFDYFSLFFTPVVQYMPKLIIHFRLVLIIYIHLLTHMLLFSSHLLTGTCLCVDAILACRLCLIHISEHRKMRAKQQLVCKKMNQYMTNTNRK